jgi:hypothetical protein
MITKGFSGFIQFACGKWLAFGKSTELRLRMICVTKEGARRRR